MWLTQRTPRVCRPSMRLTVVASAATMARRRSGPSDFETERMTAHRARAADTSVRSGVIVLDDEKIGSSVQTLSQLPRTRRGERSTCRVLCSGRDDDRGDVAAYSPFQLRGKNALVVHTRGNGDQRQRVEKIEDAGK